MSLQSLRYFKATCLEGVTILRNDGFVPTVRAALRELNLNYQGYYYYFNYRYKRARQIYRTADPFTVVQVDPKQIRVRAPPSIDRWKHIGEVRAGNWDRSNGTLEDGSKYRSVVDRFENGTPWKETDIYREALERIESGKTHWNGCRNVADIEQRTEHIDHLYQTIKTSGFQSQSELHDQSVEAIVLSGSFNRSKTDVAVAVDRNGEFLFVDGNHRIAIAHVLDLDRIPVRIVVRHSEWQDMRKEVLKTRDPSQLSNRVKRHLNHPDMQVLLPNE